MNKRSNARPIDNLDPQDRVKAGAANARLRTQRVYPPGEIPLSSWTGDAGADFSAFMRMYGRVGSRDTARVCSQGTYTLRKKIIWSVFSALRKQRRNFTTLSQFTPRLIPDILAMWSSEPAPLAISTQIQDYSILAWFWKMHGINVGSIRDHIEDSSKKTEFKRSFVATRDKSWAAAGIDIDDIIGQANAIDPVAARLIELGRTFGMRLNETIRNQPVNDDRGDGLVIDKGTKGGRPRKVDYELFGEARMRLAIDEVKSQLTEGQHAAWQGRSLKAGRQHFYYILRRLGISKSALGVTFHGLRAQWAIEKFEHLTNMKAPVRGGGCLNYRDLSEHRLSISQAMGHNRISVTSAYFGSFFAMRAPAEGRFRESWRLLSAHIPAIAQALADHGVGNLWWVGDRASGANVALGAPWEFMCDDQVELHRVLSLSRFLCSQLEDAIGLMRFVSSLTASDREKRSWMTAALPLGDVEAPQIQINGVQPMEPAALASSKPQSRSLGQALT